MKLKTSLVLGILALTCCPFGLADGSSPHQVILYLEDPGKFEVLHSRAEATNTGVALFGLIGYVVEEGYRSIKDRDREEAIQVAIPIDACHRHVIFALEDTLGRGDFSLMVKNSKAGGPVADYYVIRLSIKQCGFRLINTHTNELAAFLTARYQVLLPGERKHSEMQDLMITGKNLRHWNDLVQDQESAALEFQIVKARAGNRLANKVIFAEGNR